MIERISLHPAWIVHVEHIVVRPEEHGYWLDPCAYLEHLPKIIDDLPPGARAFAQQSGHYDFGSAECVKDLELAQIQLSDGHAELLFSANPWKHTANLTISYAGVTSASFEHHVGGPLTSPSSVTTFGTLMLDELLPASVGLTHELYFTKGVLKIAAGDLAAEWK